MRFNNKKVMSKYLDKWYVKNNLLKDFYEAGIMNTFQYTENKEPLSNIISIWSNSSLNTNKYKHYLYDKYKNIFKDIDDFNMFYLLLKAYFLDGCKDYLSGYKKKFN